MLGSISDGVFFRRRGNDNDADDAVGDCESLRRCQMLGVTADGVFLYVEAGTTTQMVPYGRLLIAQKVPDARRH